MRLPDLRSHQMRIAGKMSTKAPTWMKVTLFAAGAYNVLWGAVAILFPLAAFQWAGMPPPNYPELWQCIGMLVSVYGIGYAIAALDPYRYWPIVLAGLLGKVFGPLGFAKAAAGGRIPWDAGWTIVTNDLIWWVPFAFILRGAYQAYLGHKRTTAPEVVRFAMRAKTTAGAKLEDLSRHSPVLLVFLRHAGCTFCREALADIASQRAAIEGTGTQMVLVHMREESVQARSFFEKYGLLEVPRIADQH